MKTKKPLLVVFVALASAIGATSLFYCYGPILPTAARAVASRWDASTSYCQGWLDASIERMRGHLSYSFHGFIVEGLGEYAREVDRIDAPPKSKLGASYLAGFNRRMVGPLRHKVGPDFPDGYVRRYLDRGWLDFTTEQPLVCPVHDRHLEVAIVPLQLVFPFTIARPKFDWEIASEASFPFPGTVKRVDASLLPRPRNARVRVCGLCSTAEAEWTAAQKASETPAAATPSARRKTP